MSWLESKEQWHDLVKRANICIGANPIDVLLPWCLGMHEAKLICDKYRGNITIITSIELQRQLYSQLKGKVYEENCDVPDGPVIWTGFSDEAFEGNFVDVLDDKPLKSFFQTTPFAPSQPNGKSNENCAMAANHMHGWDWFDTNCARSLPSFCKLNENPQMKIRGRHQEIILMSIACLI